MSLRLSLALTVSLIALTMGCVKPPTETQGTTGDAEDEMTYAVVNGSEIKGKEILSKVKNDLLELKRNEYEIKRRATEEMVQQKLLEDEAKRQGTTVDKLFSQFDVLKDQDVSKDAVKEFLKARKIDEKGLSKQERESIPQIIKMQKMYEARQKYVQELRAKANVQFKIPKPPEVHVDLTTGNYPPMGSETAKVTVIEFSDFQCPYCAKDRVRMAALHEKYKDKIKIYFRNFPLESIHPQAFHAAEAAACAQDQSQFWAYHDKLFDNQDKLDDKHFIEFAKDVGIDADKFKDCLTSQKHVPDIRKDMEDGTKLGINGTPTVYIDGHLIQNSQSDDSFFDAIDEGLAK